LYFAPTAQTATATTTLAYMTPGTATTSIVYDSNILARPNIAIDKAILLTQLNASSTLTVLNTNLEYSMGVSGVDCTATPTACDWYQDNTYEYGLSTSTQPLYIATANSYRWAFASSSQGMLAPTRDRGLKAVTIPLWARYVRATYTLTGANGAVWGQIVPARQSF
jgi:hypothetical protein